MSQHQYKVNKSAGICNHTCIILPEFAHH